MDTHKNHKAFVQMANRIERTSGHNECCSVLAELPCSETAVAIGLVGLVKRCRSYITWCRVQYWKRSLNLKGWITNEETDGSWDISITWKINSGLVWAAGPVHTVSFQIFRSPSIHVSFLVKNCTQEFFREITTFSSKTLSFDIFFILTWKMSTIIDFKVSFHLEAREILRRSWQIKIH